MEQGGEGIELTSDLTHPAGDAGRHTVRNVEGATPDSDERFAEWYAWAKREVSSDGRVCLGVAQAAMDATEAGADRTAAEAAARRSVAGTAVVLLAKVSPWRRGYAQWYDWARLELGGDPARLHRLTRIAIQRLQAGGDVDQAAEAARSAAAADPTGRAPDMTSQAAPGSSWSPRGPVTPGGWGGPPFSPGAGAPPGFATSLTSGLPPVPGSERAPSAPAPAEPLSFAPAVYAGFGRRLAAVAVDAILGLLGTAVVVVVAAVLFFIAVFSARVSTGQAALTELALLVIVCLLFWLYDAGLESSPARATMGKRALGLSVIDKYGRPISFGRATARHFVKFVPLFLSVIPLYLSIESLTAGFVNVVALAVGVVGLIFLVCVVIELVMILLTRQKQGLHDLISGTLVVRRELLSQVVSRTTSPPPPPLEAVPESHSGAPVGVARSGETVSPGG